VTSPFAPARDVAVRARAWRRRSRPRVTRARSGAGAGRVRARAWPRAWQRLVPVRAGRRSRPRV